MSAISKKTTSNKTGNWRSKKPVVTDKCIGCGTCVPVCPESGIVIENKRAKINYDFCKGCFVCKEVCPVKAVEDVEEK